MKNLVTILLSIGILIKLNAQDLDSLSGTYYDKSPRIHCGAHILLKNNTKFEFHVRCYPNSYIHKGHYIKKNIFNDIVLQFIPDAIENYQDDSLGIEQLYESRPYDRTNSYDSLSMPDRNFLLGYYNNIPFLISLDTFAFGNHHSIAFRKFINQVHIDGKIYYGYFRQEKQSNGDIMFEHFPEFFGKSKELLRKRLITTKIIEQVIYQPNISFLGTSFDSILYYKIDKGYKDGVFVGMEFVKWMDTIERNAYHIVATVKVYENYSIVERNVVKFSSIKKTDPTFTEMEFRKKFNYNFEGLIFRNSFWLE